MTIDAIATWEDWCQSFQQIKTFEGLIHEIFERHNLRVEQIENTYPGTHTVFKVGVYIVKIFVPSHVKPWDEDDYAIELRNALDNDRIRAYTPKLYGHGAIKKSGLWQYLIYEYVEAKHFFEVIDHLSYDEKKMIVAQLKRFLARFNVKPKAPFDHTNLINRVIKSKRWDFLNDGVQIELFEYIKHIDVTDSVIVHGDITGDNVLFNKDGIVIIDFGDSCLAPFYYEYAPIALDLFKLDKALMVLFCEGELDVLIERIIKSILIHDFGGDMAAVLLQGHHVASLVDLQDSLRKAINRRFDA